MADREQYRRSEIFLEYKEKKDLIIGQILDFMQNQNTQPIRDGVIMGQFTQYESGLILQALEELVQNKKIIRTKRGKTGGPYYKIKA